MIWWLLRPVIALRWLRRHANKPREYMCDCDYDPTDAQRNTHASWCPMLWK